MVRNKSNNNCFAASLFSLSVASFSLLTKTLCRASVNNTILRRRNDLDDGDGDLDGDDGDDDCNDVSPPPIVSVVISVI